MDGVERGNIVAWRQELARGLEGQPIEFGPVMGRRSILLAMVGLFAAAIVLGLSALGLVLYLTFRMGRAAQAAPPGQR